MNNLTRKPRLHNATAALVVNKQLVPAGLALLLLMAVLPSLAVAAQPARKGKVLIVRGAFTIFSLGLDTLGSKLRKQGCDVVVSTAATSGLNADVIIDEKKKNPDMPLVIVGHSRGGLLAPDLAKQFGQAGMKVDLVVIIDNTHKITMPRNVTRTVNLYHTNIFGVMHGLQVKGLKGGGKVLNVDIKNIPGRDKAGYLDHFNIEESPWIHDIVMGEVLKFCPTPQELAAQQQAAGQVAANQPNGTTAHTPGAVHVETSDFSSNPQRAEQPSVQVAPAPAIRQPQSIASLPVQGPERKPARNIRSRYAQNHPSARTSSNMAPKRAAMNHETRAAKPAFEYGNIHNPEIVVE